MAELQTVYATDLDRGYPGMVANGETSNRISRTIEDVAGIGFGKAAFRGVGDHGCTATPSAAFLGFTIAHEALGFIAGQTADTYPQYENVAIEPLGPIWAIAAANLADGDDIFITPATGITNTSNGGANFAANGWKADTTAANGTLVRLVRR